MTLDEAITMTRLSTPSFAALFVAAVLSEPTMVRPAAAGFFLSWGHTQNAPTAITSYGPAVSVVPTMAMPSQIAIAGSRGVPGVTILPTTAAAFAGVSAGPSTQFVSAIPAVGASPPAFGASSPGSYYWVQGTPAQANFTVAPQGGGGASPPVASAGTGTAVDSDYLVLTSGFGGSFSKVRDFEKILKSKLESLVNQKGGILNKQEIVVLLLDFAKGYLNTTGFGFLINDALDPILNRLITRLFQERQATPSDNTTPTPAPSPTPIPTPIPAPTPGHPIPAGGGSFKISGTMVLSPSSENGSAGQNLTPEGNPPSNGTIPGNLSPDDGAQPANSPSP